VNAPRYPLQGVVSWNMNTTCNYRCSYCTQRFVDDRKQWARDLPAFVMAFSALAGDWEVKLSGGEPFRHPDFLAGVRGLVEGGLRVSVVTNLSSSQQVLADYLRITAPRPGVLSVSMHLEYVDVDEFIAKVGWLASAHDGPVVTTCVGTKALLPRLAVLQRRWNDAGLKLLVQPEKQDRDVIAYTAAERETLLTLGGHNGLGQIDPNLNGRACWAGSRYFIVDHRGHAYRCYPARRQRSEYLGNLLDGTLRLTLDASPCRYGYCNCTVPQGRGMVDVRDAPAAQVR
jgi:MoaA/NifB/PqqE/SkfB family radical SAM enzyme